MKKDFLQNHPIPKGFSILIANDDREKVFAEIYFNGEQWAEISQEEKKPVITLFTPLQGDRIEFFLDEFLDVIEKAKKKRLG